VRQLQRIADSTGSLDDKVDKLASTFKKLAGGLGVAFGAKEIIDNIKSTSEAFDQLGKDAQKIGVSVEDLQRLRFVAGDAGVGAEQLDKAIKALAVNMGHLGVATDDATTTLKAIGITRGDSPLVALEKIADRFAKMPDGVEKATEVVSIFGKKAGPDMVPLLNQGGKAIKDFAASLDRFGGVVSQETIDQAASFNTNLMRLGKTAEGAKAQFEAGILPALDALTTSLTDVTKTGTGFKGWGDAVSKELIGLAGLAILAGNAFQKIANFVKFATSMKSMSEAIADFKKENDKLTQEGANALDKLADAYAKAALAATGHGEAAKKASTATSNALADEAKKQEHAAMMARVNAAAAAALVEIKQKDIEVSLQLNQQQVQLERTLHPLQAAIDDTKKAYDDFVEAQKKADLQMASYNALIGEGTHEQREWIAAQMLGTTQVNRSMEAVAKQSDELKAFNEGFDRFVDSLSSGSVTVAEAFQGMIKSILADLLKIWAKRYIIEAIFGTSTAKAAKGLVFDAGEVLPFARGGIVSQPLMLPMALMGEAGPEAVMPLKRGADGNLGVAAAAAAFHVTVNNNAPGVDVSARRTGPGDLEILIEQTKRSIAADFRRGGNDIARSAESAWSLSRGTAAPF